MMKTAVGLVFSSMLLAGAAAAAEPADAPAIKAGAATRIVNPSKPAASCAAREPIRLDQRYADICTQAVAIEDAGGKRVVLISSDFMMIPHEVADRIRELVLQKHGIAADAVCVHATHNHAAPPLVPREAMAPGLYDAAYVDFFVNETLAAVGEAIAQLSPVRIRYCEDVCTSVAINRRGRGPDGKVLPITPNNTGIVDFTVRVVAMDAVATGKPAIILFEYAAHPVTTYNRLGADYPGYAREFVKAKFPGTAAIFLQGCAGNIRVQILNDDRKGWVKGTPEMARRFGFDLADAVERAVAKAGVPIVGPIEARRTEVRVPLVPTASPNTIPFRVQAFRFGAASKHPFVLIGLGTEPFIEYGLELQRRLTPANVMVIGYANALAGYLPTAKGCEEGGYEPNAWNEGWYALPGPYAKEAEAVVLDAAMNAAGSRQ